jgi:3-hydroxyisobutyrate dehydrogenase-like beta-hydroxyacid dehydrogenase
VRVGFIGLGEMGLPMAANLVRAGHVVTGYDLDQARLEAAEAAGVERAATTAAAALAADAVITMLRTGAQTQELLAGDGGLAASVMPGRPLDTVIMSTAEPELVADLARGTAGRLAIVDAPVSGGVRGAEAATLAILAAGPPEAVERVRPLLDALGGAVFVLGPEAGLGQAAKVANQVMMGAALAGTMEALALARAYGLEDAAVREAVLAGTGASWVLDHWSWMRSLWEAYEPGGALDILIKDLRATIAAGVRHDVSLPATALALERLLERIDG